MPDFSTRIIIGNVFFCIFYLLFIVLPVFWIINYFKNRKISRNFILISILLFVLMIVCFMAGKMISPGLSEYFTNFSIE
jgi:hypothetical protein